MVANENIATRQETATHFHIALPTLTRWVDLDGCPVHQRGAPGKRWLFDIAIVEKWRTAYMLKLKQKDSGDPDNYIAAKLAKILVETEHLKIKLKQRRKELVLVEDVGTIVEGDYLNLKRQLLALPNKISDSLVSINDVEEMKKMFTEYIKEVLEELSSGKKIVSRTKNIIKDE